MDGQAREGEKAGRHSSQCRKKGKSFWKRAPSSTPKPDLVGRDSVEPHQLQFQRKRRAGGLTARIGTGDPVGHENPPRIQGDTYRTGDWLLLGYQQPLSEIGSPLY